MNTLKKLLIFLIVSFKLSLYIINETITTNPLIMYLYVLVIFLLALPTILNLKFDKSSFIKTMTILAISFIMFILYKEDNIFLYAIIALMTLDDDNKEMIKIFFWSSLMIYIITLFLGACGYLQVDDVYRTIDGTSAVRNSLGFANANAVFTYFVPIVLSGIYLYGKSNFFTVIVFLSATVLFSYCKSRTGYYLTLFILFTNLFSKQQWILKIKHRQFLFCFIVSLLIACCFGISEYNSVNQLLSYRPWYYLQFLKQGPFVWGGGLSEHMVLDNLYFHLLAYYSIIGFGLYYYIFTEGLLLNKEPKIAFISFFFLSYGIFEAVTIANFTIVIFLKEIFLKYRGEENND